MALILRRKTLTLSLFASMLVFLTLIPRSKSASTYRYSSCYNSTSFQTSNEYQFNVATVLNSLTSNATTPTGFSTATAGTNTKDAAVYGLFLCRGDLDPTSCKSCVAASATALRQTYCPRGKVAVIWYDECMVRYSNKSFFGKVDVNPENDFENVRGVPGNVTLFLQVLGRVVQNVSTRAANGGDKKYATDVEIISSDVTMYTMAQCTPDLSTVGCKQCLEMAIARLPSSQGGRIVQPSCNIRYETYPFYNGATASLSPPGNSNTPMITPHSRGKRKISAGAIIAIVVPIAVIATGLALALVLCFVKKKSKENDVDAVEVGEDFPDSLQYSLATLQYATNSFSDSNKLGEGGFGVVYKGVLKNGYEIAVKKLSENSSQGIQEFRNEALLVAKLQHRNLVKFLGFCLEGEEKLLVYEYVANRSLDLFLFDSKKKAQLNWQRRYKIIAGIARGMLYIHQDSQLRIIHRDLKTSNVLLDEDMNPKISDFGMARIFGADQTQGNTSRVVGTHGYMSPEYAMHGQYSVKSDVYSFGIIVLEIISGKKNSSFYEAGDDDLLTFAWKNWSDGTPLDFVDPEIKDSCEAQEVTRCLHLALLCAQESINQRPTMATIVLTLDTNSVTLPMPDQPGLILKVSGTTNSSFPKASGPDQSSSTSMSTSVNNITITELDAR